MSLSHRIEPFAGLLYDAARAGALSNVVAPPYDLIDKTRQDALYARSLYNVVRLELNRDQDRYASAARTLHDWLDTGVLKLSPRPAVYSYSQFFEVDGRYFRREGLIVRIKLEEFSAGRILPHERTFPAAKQDRLELLSALGANVSPIFGLYTGAYPALASLLGQVTAEEPALEITDDLGIRNQLRFIEDRSAIEAIQRELESARIFIADGHHRYETALEYRRRRRAADGNPPGARSYDYAMMTLVASDDPGLVILPTYRVARRLEQHAIASFDEHAQAWFDIEECANADSMRASLAAAGRDAIAAALGGDREKFRILRLRDPGALADAMPSAPDAVRRLAVSILHGLVLERIFGITPEQVKAGGVIGYTIDAREALSNVAPGSASGAFLLNAPAMSDIEAVSDAGAVMPEKSTYFYPKLLTGLVMNPLEDEASLGV
jgi:uncharacterized protein (DUF1015 family)